jgi:hypothetical protein
MQRNPTSQKRSDVALVTSSNSDSLIELDDRPGADMTARLLLALTALYVQRPTHTTEEQQQYVELALRLIDKVEGGTRTAVGRILQRHPDAPAEVVARLGGRQAEDGKSIRPPPLAGKGREGAFGDAFFAASAAERRRLLSLVERSGGDDVEAAPEDGERRYGNADEAALPSRIGEFAREFGQLIDIPTRVWERILNDPSGEPMVVAAKATDMPIAILQRILLLVSASASYSVQRVYDLTDLYHGLDGSAARHILALWRTQAKRNDPIPDTGLNTPDRRLGTPCLPPYPPAHAGEGRVGASLRARFGALTARVHGYAVNARADRGSVARRGLRSR